MYPSILISWSDCASENGAGLSTTSDSELLEDNAANGNNISTIVLKNISLY